MGLTKALLFVPSPSEKTLDESPCNNITYVRAATIGETETAVMTIVARRLPRRLTTGGTMKSDCEIRDYQRHRSDNSNKEIAVRIRRGLKIGISSSSSSGHCRRAEGGSAVVKRMWTIRAVLKTKSLSCLHVFDRSPSSSSRFPTLFSHFNSNSEPAACDHKK